MVKMQWFGNKTNLHTVWDTYLLEYVNFSYSDYALFLVDSYGHQYQKVKTMSREDELRRTYDMVSQIYDYQTSFDGNTYHYAYRWKDALNYQLYVAGVKVAQILNTIYR